MQRLAGLARFVPLRPYDYVGRKEACNICGASATLPVSGYDRRIKRLNTVVCSDCGLIRTDPMPTEAELADYYRHSYRLDYQLAGSGPPRRHLVRTRAEAVRRADLFAPVLAPGARVLDYGCGSGEFLAEGGRRQWTMVGVEPGEAYAGYARGLGLSVHSDLPQTEEPFDAITSNHVFEHLRDPLGTLRSLVALLKPEGVLYLAVPDMGPSPRPAFDRLHFAHVHGFLPETLDLLASSAGLCLDPRFPRQGTNAVYTRGSCDLRPDPTLAERVRAGFNPISPLAYILGGAWIGATYRRLKRDVADTLWR
ncbi:class I SAM-dependent methyltransferase [Roseococcus sp. SYP-B2431]|uniref:class I SAM-dependent methyltransferase n=1 Tax=Roseococcus sp. SYP-B2431 TaxID=2496640 RepID=UPI00103D38D6|nr:class I SAM-dependent methyltransferase [Roseococcus sp. SYP-B2431]TCH96334.1 class I SAM-dependent methyltransferase [Roseococcus sp. SYP-B2431]